MNLGSQEAKKQSRGLALRYSCFHKRAEYFLTDQHVVYDGHYPRLMHRDRAP